MRYAWNEEQRLLRNMLYKYIADRHSFEEHRRRAVTGFDPRMWKEMAELGIFGLPFAEEYGGTGGTQLDMVVVMEAFGRGLVVDPFVPTVVLGGGLLHHGGDAAQKAEFIPPLIEGDMLFAFAFAEAHSRFNLANVLTTATAHGDEYVLHGQKIMVYGAAEADALFVTVRTGGGPCEAEGVSLFLVPKTAPGLSLRSYRTMDGMSSAEVTFESVRVPRTALVGEPDGALKLVEQVLDEAVTATCAEAVGAMAMLNERCLDYAKTREAFGQAISKFQVIQHRLVDMSVSFEQASAIVLKSAETLIAAPLKRARAASACKVLVAQEGAFVGKSAVQLHGAIGITEELDVGHYFKRLTLFQSQFGSADHHLRRYIHLSGGQAPGSSTNGY